MSDNVNVLYQFNEAYVPFAGISMTSLFENNKDINTLTVYVLDEDITQDSKNKLIKNAEKYGRSIVFFNTEILVKNMIELGIPPYRNSYATNMKMFIPMFLDKSIERILYIDSDTIITGSISDFYFSDLGNNAISMILDSFGGNHKLYVGLNRRDDYYNGGVILYDVFKWREEKCTDLIVSHVKNIRAHYMSPDQDLINIVLNDKIKKADLRYNLQPLHTAYPVKLGMRFFPQDNYYDNETIKEALEHPVIVHTFRFLGEFPWHIDSLHPSTPLFDKYMAISEWNDYKKTEPDQNGLIFKIERMMYKILPKSIFIVIFKICYELFLYNAAKKSEKNINSNQM